jgi:hypothetical protein
MFHVPWTRYPLPVGDDSRRSYDQNGGGTAWRWCCTDRPRAAARSTLHWRWFGACPGSLGRPLPGPATMVIGAVAVPADAQVFGSVRKSRLAPSFPTLTSNEPFENTSLLIVPPPATHWWWCRDRRALRSGSRSRDCRRARCPPRTDGPCLQLGCRLPTPGRPRRPGA